MLGGLREAKVKRRFPVNAYPNLVRLQSPEDGFFGVEVLVALTDKLVLIGKDPLLLQLVAESTAAFEISKPESVGLMLAEVLLELPDLFLLADFGTLRLVQPKPAGQLDLVLQLLVHQQLHFSQPHPLPHHQHKRQTHQLHLVAHLVEDSLDALNVELFCEFEAFGGERGHCLGLRAELHLQHLAPLLAVFNPQR